MRIIFAAAFAAVAIPFAGSTLAAEIGDLSALDQSKAADVYSCYSRHYDEARLKSHPKQNVHDMTVFVDSTYDATDNTRTHQVEMGVGFRGLKQLYRVSGGCSTVDSQKSLSCGIDCDGGHFDVTSQGVGTILLAIPDYARIWDPNEPTDAEPGSTIPKSATWGDDDKQFRLESADISQCKPLMSDEQAASIFGTKTTASK